MRDTILGLTPLCAGLCTDLCQIMVVNRAGDVVHTGATRSVASAAKDACAAITGDWREHGRLDVPPPAPPAPENGFVARELGEGFLQLQKPQAFLEACLGLEVQLLIPHRLCLRAMGNQVLGIGDQYVSGLGGNAFPDLSHDLIDECGVDIGGGAALTCFPRSQGIIQLLQQA
jgi:hypothetical protein